MAASTIPTAKAQLLTTLQARAGLVGVAIQWGIPAKLPAELERIYLTDATDVNREWAQLGNTQKLEETYLMPVIVEAFRHGDEQQLTEERMWAIAAEVEGAVRDDLSLNQKVRWNRPLLGDPRTFPADEGWLATVTLRFSVYARI